MLKKIRSIFSKTSEEVTEKEQVSQKIDKTCAALIIEVALADKIFDESAQGGSNNLVLDTWQHIIFTRDSSNNIKCFRNGTSYGSSSGTLNSNTLTYNSIGRVITNTFGFEGGLDEIAFWNSDQTANINNIYSSLGAVDLSALNPYAESKLKLENFIIEHSKNNNINFVILRYFNVAGADEKMRTGLISKHSTHLIKVACEVATKKRDKLIINGNDYCNFVNSTRQSN